MCKSEHERGGPYRCSADMKRNFDRAQNRFQDTLVAHTEAVQERNKADHDLAVLHDISRTQAEADAKAGDNPPPPADAAFREQRRAKTDADLVAARRRVAHAQETVTKTGKQQQTAGRKFAAARRDYQATPAGIAELQSDIDAERAALPGGGRDERIADLVNERDTALEKMNTEGRERTRRWNTAPSRYVPMERTVPAHQADYYPQSASRQTYAEFAHDDNLSASAKNYGYRQDDHGREFEDYEVTFTRPTGDGQTKTMKVSYAHNIVDPDPTVGDVLSTMGDQAARYEATKEKGFRHYCASQGADLTDADEVDSWRDEYASGKRYSHQLRTFFADDATRADLYVHGRP